MIPIDLPLALAYVVVSGLIPALKTLPPSPIPSSNPLQNPPAVVLSPHSGLTHSDVKLLPVGEETVIRYSVENQGINNSL